MKWLVLVILLLTSSCGGCRDSGACDDDTDCFATESCQERTCVPGTEVDAGPICDPSECMGPLVAETICSLDVCEIIACEEQAVLCASGCCKVGPVEQHQVPIGSDELFFTPQVGVGANGFPHIVYAEFEANELFHLFWDGATWQREQLALFPTPLITFDIAVDESNRLWIAYTGTDENAYVAEPDEFGGYVTRMIFEAPPRDPDQLALFLRFSLEVRGDGVAVCALYGTESLVLGETTHASLPHVWEGRKMFNTGEYRGARVAGFERASLCSTAFSPSGQRHIAFSAVSEVNDDYVIEWAEEPQDGTGFDFDTDPPLYFGVLGHPDALEIDGDGIPHIVFGQRYLGMDGAPDTAQLVHLWRDSTGWMPESLVVENDLNDDLAFVGAALQWATNLHITFYRANVRTFDIAPWAGMLSNGAWGAADLGLGFITVFEQRVGADGRAHRIWIERPTAAALNYAAQ